MTMFLTANELRILTGRQKPSAQARMLQRMNIAYIPHPEGPRVLRQTIEGANIEPEWEPDFSVIHGPHKNHQQSNKGSSSTSQG